MKKLPKRTLASRANGKLSRGLVTPAGLLRASANSTRHSLLAENLVLDDESKDIFAILHQQFIDRLNPTDGVEICLVEDLASTVWRQRRLVAIETHLFKEAGAKRPEQTYLGRIGGAFSDLCQTPEIHLLDRYESRLHRMFQRTLKNLQLLRQIEHTNPSTGELTELPVEVTGVLDAPADPATSEFPNEPSSAEPAIESASYPTTSTANPEPDNAEDLSIKAESDFSLLLTNPRAEESEDLSIKGGADLSLLPTGPQVPPQQPPQVPPAPSTTEIHEIPNEPKSAQPPAESTAPPITSILKPKPVDPYAGYPRFELNPITGGLKRIA